MKLNVSNLLITNDQSNIDMAETHLSIYLREIFDEIKRVFSLTEKELAEILFVSTGKCATQTPVD